MYNINTRSPAETTGLGTRLASHLAPGDFIALTGDLGAGKTQFAKGVASGLLVDPSLCVTSPTFTLLNVYSGRIPLYHFDFYRLHGQQDAIDLGFEEYFYGDGVCLIEWGERLGDEMPQEHLLIRFTITEEEQRLLTFIPCGERAEEIVRKLLSE
jgi:tRNA threonylcarbamoyladenosine biosynthesis protein TsaE